MPIVGRQFNNLQELLDHLNNIMLGSRDLAPTLNLNGLTLLLDDGAPQTVTFTGTAVTPNDVVAQINAVVAGAASLRNYGHSAPPRSKLAFVLGALTVKVTGTANALLGLPTAGSDVVVGASAVARADIISITEFTNRFTVVYDA